MRRLFEQLLAIAALGVWNVGCKPDRLVDVQDAVRLSSTQLDFGRVAIGSSRTASITLTNVGRSAIRTSVSTAEPFSALNEIVIPGGSQVPLSFTATANAGGRFEATAAVDFDDGEEPQSVLLAATFIDVGECPKSENPCEEADVDENGVCAERTRGDGSACSTPCIATGVCASGACVGEVRNCDDGIACTIDACDPLTGCVHSPDDHACGEPSACKTPACVPDIGCVTNVADDGSACGYGDCGGGRVCLSGSCQWVDRPDWAENPPCSTACLAGCEITSFAMSTKHRCAVKQGGTVWCMGFNDHGQLGDPAFVDQFSAVPRQVPGLPPATQVVASEADFTCALTEFGDIYCWGFNGWDDQSGQRHAGLLGTGNFGDTDLRAPERVILPEPAKEFGDGYQTPCALLVGGSVWCWGMNNTGQMGLGYRSGVSPAEPVGYPIQLSNLGDAVHIGVFGYGGCALQKGERLSCWSNGLFGKYLVSEDGQPPTEIERLPAFRWLSSSYGSPFALTEDGTLYSWHMSQPLHESYVPDFGTSFDDTPESLPFLTGVASACGNGWARCALMRSGDVMCWGWNDAGELGNGLDGPTTWPAQPPVLSPTKVDIPAARFLSCSPVGSCAGTTDGQIFCWGADMVVWELSGRSGKSVVRSPTALPF